jgi:hypothetical protein
MKITVTAAGEGIFELTWDREVRWSASSSPSLTVFGDDEIHIQADQLVTLLETPSPLTLSNEASTRAIPFGPMITI